jgi:hypothetical protein
VFQTGWISKKGNCYYVVTQYLEWKAANASCNNMGGHLVSIHSLSENEDVTTLLGMDFWIGLSVTEPDYILKWSDGTDIDFTHFEISQLSKNNCFYLQRYNNGLWKESDCLVYKQSVCKH